MQDFRQLVVWQRAHKLTLSVYQRTLTFPVVERYGLTSQLRRAAISIAANIAEGAGRASGRDFARFLTMAAGSASELEYHLLLAYDLGLLEQEGYLVLSGEVAQIRKMIVSLARRLSTSGGSFSDLDRSTSAT